MPLSNLIIRYVVTDARIRLTMLEVPGRVIVRPRDPDPAPPVPIPAQPAARPADEPADAPAPQRRRTPTARASARASGLGRGRKPGARYRRPTAGVEPGDTINSAPAPGTKQAAFLEWFRAASWCRSVDATGAELGLTRQAVWATCKAIARRGYGYECDGEQLTIKLPRSAWIAEQNIKEEAARHGT